MKMHRITTGLASALICVMALTACGPSANSDGTTTTDSTASTQSDTASQSAATTQNNTGLQNDTAGAAAETNTEAVSWAKNLKSDGRTFVRVALDQDPGTFDPALFGSAMGLEQTAYLMREGLFERDRKGNLIPQIAESYTMDADNMTYHVKMYDYVYDTAGNHITADDVVFCFNRAKENGFNSTSFYDSVTKDGDYAVTINLNSTSKGVFEQVTQVVLIYSKAAYDATGDDFGTKPVFTGPYKLTEWNIGTSLTFEANTDYWQKPELRNPYAVQNVDIIEFAIIKESAQIAIALETGQVDIVGNMNSMEVQRFMAGGSSSAGFNVFDYSDSVTRLLYLNEGKTSPFRDNLALRKAVMYAIDMDTLIDGAVDGYGIASKTFGNAMIPDYQTAWDSQEYFDFNVDKAKDFLKEAGYAPNALSVRIMCNNNELHGMIAQILQGFLLQVGIKSEILAYEDAMFNTYKNDETQWDLLIDKTAWSGPTVTKWRDQFDRYPNETGSIINVSDPEFTALLKKAQEVATYDEASVNAFHQYLKDQAYARGLFNQKAFCVSSNIMTKQLNHRSGFLYPAGCTYAWN